jgi:hypothetical protein
MIQRYEIEGPDWAMVPNALDGNVVLYVDAESEVAALRAEVARLREMLTWCQTVHRYCDLSSPPVC